MLVLVGDQNPYRKPPSIHLQLRYVQIFTDDLRSFFYQIPSTYPRFCSSSLIELPVLRSFLPFFQEQYPPVIKHGVLENGPFLNDSPMKSSDQFGDFPASHV